MTNPLDLSIGKGIVSFTPSGGSKRDLGECESLEITPALEKLEYKGNRSGVRSTVRSIILEKTAQARFVLAEWSPENLALAMLGQVDTAGTGFEIFAESEIAGELEFVGTNDIGPKYTVILPNVSIIPQGAVSFISDEWGRLELTADVLLDEYGSFGTVTQTEAGA